MKRSFPYGGQQPSAPATSYNQPPLSGGPPPAQQNDPYANYGYGANAQHVQAQQTQYQQQWAAYYAAQAAASSQPASQPHQASVTQPYTPQQPGVQQPSPAGAAYPSQYHQPPAQQTQTQTQTQRLQYGPQQQQASGPAHDYSAYGYGAQHQPHPPQQQHWGGGAPQAHQPPYGGGSTQHQASPGFAGPPAKRPRFDAAGGGSNSGGYVPGGAPAPGPGGPTQQSFFGSPSPVTPTPPAAGTRPVHSPSPAGGAHPQSFGWPGAPGATGTVGGMVSSGPAAMGGPGPGPGPGRGGGPGGFVGGSGVGRGGMHGTAAVFGGGAGMESMGSPSVRGGMPGFRGGGSRGGFAGGFGGGAGFPTGPMARAGLPASRGGRAGGVVGAPLGPSGRTASGGVMLGVGSKPGFAGGPGAGPGGRGGMINGAGRGGRGGGVNSGPNGLTLSEQNAAPLGPRSSMRGGTRSGGATRGGFADSPGRGKPTGRGATSGALREDREGAVPPGSKRTFTDFRIRALEIAQVNWEWTLDGPATKEKASESQTQQLEEGFNEGETGEGKDVQVGRHAGGEQEDGGQAAVNGADASHKAGSEAEGGVETESVAESATAPDSASVKASEEVDVGVSVASTPIPTGPKGSRAQKMGHPGRALAHGNTKEGKETCRLRIYFASLTAAQKVQAVKEAERRKRALADAESPKTAERAATEKREDEEEDRTDAEAAAKALEAADIQPRDEDMETEAATATGNEMETGEGEGTTAKEESGEGEGTTGKEGTAEAMADAMETDKCTQEGEEQQAPATKSEGNPSASSSAISISESKTEATPSTAESPAKPRTKGPPQPAFNRLIISYAGSKRRLHIDADIVQSIKVFRKEGRIEMRLSVERPPPEVRELKAVKKAKKSSTPAAAEEDPWSGWSFVRGLLFETRDKEDGQFVAVSRQRLEELYNARAQPSAAAADASAEDAATGAAASTNGAGPDGKVTPSVPVEEGDASLPPLHNLPNDEHSLVVVAHLNRENPLTEPKWLKTGDMEEWLHQLQGWDQRKDLGEGEWGWMGKIHVVDPDPAPTLHDFLDTWSGDSDRASYLSDPDSRRSFVSTYLSDTDGLIEIVLRLVRGERASTVSQSQLGKPLAEAASSSASPFASHQTHLSLAVLAIYRLAKEYAHRAGAEAEELQRRVEEILIGLPPHLLTKAVDGLLKEVESKRREEKKRGASSS